MAEWVAQARAALAAGPTAMVSVLATEGSAPRGAGTRMLVAADGFAGTIGGGRLEWQAIAQARAMLAHPPGTWRVQDYPLGPLLGQCCGGRVRLLVERLADAPWLTQAELGATLVTRLGDGVARTIDPSATPAPIAARGAQPTLLVERIGETRRPVYLFGAGHVGRAIARVLAPLPFALAWFDTRAEAAETAGVVHLDVADAAACIAQAPAGAAILVLTHDHALDYRLVAAALAGPARHVGLIGSATKRARFLRRLAAEGIDAARLVCPIGLSGVIGKEPEVIAVAVAAELLAQRGRP